jgi:hypothetical protein
MSSSFISDFNIRGSGDLTGGYFRFVIEHTTESLS